MKDKEIISYFLERNEDAISEIQKKYGAYCFTVANNILCNPEDAEECVNDTWHIAWNKIPPIIPASFRAFLGKVVRNQALIMYRNNHAKKRYSGIEILLDELEECIPSTNNIEDEIDSKALGETINSWLEKIPSKDREMFIRRYYLCESVEAMSKYYRCTQNAINQKMMKLRGKLKDFLSQEGFDL